MDLGYRFGNRVQLEHRVGRSTQSQWAIFRSILESQDLRDWIFERAAEVRFFSWQEVYIDHASFTVPIVLLAHNSDDDFCQLVTKYLSYEPCSPSTPS